MPLAHGCSTKAQLDHAVDEIVSGLGDCDKARVAKVAHSGMDVGLDSKFDAMCETVQWFGPLKSRKQTSIAVSTGQSQGSYALAFENGELTLDVSVEGDEIVAFKFAGEAWLEAQRAVHAAAFSEFKVYEFEWRDADGNPNAEGGQYPPGGVPWWLKLGGLAAKGGKHVIGIKLRVRGADGKVMIEDPKFEVVEIDAEPGEQSIVAELHATTQIPDTGTFHLEFDLRDEISGKEASYSQSVRVWKSK